MILESSTVVLLLTAGVTGALVVASAVLALVSLRRGPEGDERSRVDRRARLAVLGSVLLFAVFASRVISWPALLLCLEGLTPLIAGAMCGYGVLQATPELSFALGLTKVGGLFALTVCVVLRRLRAGEPSGASRIVHGLALLIALADAGADAAFATAPRETVEVTCCTTVLDASDRLSSRVPERVLGVDAGQKVLSANLAVGAAALFLLLLSARRWTQAGAAPRAIATLGVLASLLTLPLGGLTAMEWITPCILHLPHHHCLVETWTQTPDGGLLLAFLLGGSLLPAAATLAHLLAGEARRRDAARHLLARLLRAGAWTGCAFLVMATTHLAVAEWLP